MLGRRSLRVAFVCALAVAITVISAGRGASEPKKLTLTVAVVDARCAVLPGAQVRLWAVAQGERRVVTIATSDSKGEVRLQLSATEWYELEVALQPVFIVTRVGPFEIRKNSQFTITLNTVAETIVVE